MTVIYVKMKEDERCFTLFLSVRNFLVFVLFSSRTRLRPIKIKSHVTHKNTQEQNDWKQHETRDVKIWWWRWFLTVLSQLWSWCFCRDWWLYCSPSTSSLVFFSSLYILWTDKRNIYCLLYHLYCVLLLRVDESLNKLHHIKSTMTLNFLLDLIYIWISY